MNNLHFRWKTVFQGVRFLGVDGKELLLDRIAG